jgi:hypothetical protein
VIDFLNLEISNAFAILVPVNEEEWEPVPLFYVAYSAALRLRIIARMSCARLSPPVVAAGAATGVGA